MSTIQVAIIAGSVVAIFYFMTSCDMKTEQELTNRQAVIVGVTNASVIHQFWKGQ